MLVIVFIVYSILFVYEFVPLYKQKLWKDFWVNATLGVFSLTIAILLGLGIEIPSPAKPLKMIITTILGK